MKLGKLEKQVLQILTQTETYTDRQTHQTIRVPVTLNSHTLAERIWRTVALGYNPFTCAELVIDKYKVSLLRALKSLWKKGLIIRIRAENRGKYWSKGDKLWETTGCLLTKRSYWKQVWDKEGKQIKEPYMSYTGGCRYLWQISFRGRLWYKWLQQKKEALNND
jgi:hypothetical protein